jgi:signal transduction histidine kinase
LKQLPKEQICLIDTLVDLLQILQRSQQLLRLLVFGLFPNKLKQQKLEFGLCHQLQLNTL